MMKKLLFSVLLCVFALSANAQSNFDEAYSYNVKKLMELSSVKETVSTTLGETYAALAPQLGLSEAKAHELGVLLANAIYDDYIEVCIPIYKKYFTLEDIVEVCEFYSTPTGKKFSKYSSQIAIEAMANVQSLLPKVLPIVEEFIIANRGK